MGKEPHGPMELPDGGIASNEELDAFSTMQHVRTKLAEMGIEEPMKPQFDLPDVPPDISSVTDKEIADLYSKMLSWDSYFSLQAAWANAELKEAKNKHTLIVSKLTGGAKKTKAGEFESDPRVMEAKAEVQQLEQVSGILETTHKVFTAKLRMVSRNIELRKLDWEKSMRDGSVRSTAAIKYPHNRLGGDRKK